MFIKDLVMWGHYNVIIENSHIAMRSWQRLAISDNLNLLSDYVIWNILVLNIKGKVKKIAIKLINVEQNLYIVSWHLLGHAIKSVTCFDLQFSRSTRRWRHSVYS